MNKTEIEEILITNDKTHAPFLLACSFNNHISYAGSFAKDGIVYWKFAPRLIAQNLIDNFEVKVDPKIPLKDIFDAQTAFWRKVYDAKKGE